MARPAALIAIERRWLRLPPNIRGGLWVIMATTIGTFMFLSAKSLGSNLHIAQITASRTVIAVVLMLPVVARIPRHKFRTKRPWAHIICGVLGVVSLFCAFYAVNYLHFADAVAYGFTRPLFVIVLASLFLGEAVGIRRTAATLTGFAGVLIMMRPSGAIDPAILIALAGALMAAISMAIIKRIAVTEDRDVQIFYFIAISAVVAIGPGIAMWRAPTADEWVLLGVVGVTGWLNNICYIRGLRVAEASALMPFDYTRLPLAALFGFLLFDEVPDAWMWLGAGLIIAATLYIARRESQLGRAPRIEGGTV
jgi:drug/metabolite transporter (DMT)-like permease